MADFDYDNDSLFEPSPSSTLLSSSVLHRILGPAPAAGGESSPVVDYTVVGVIVITLGLILVIEVLRQKLDEATSGHSFSKVVVELMYRECKFR